ncbi:hypothetical protein [Crassaminicella profunda]|uniref:hypothetical protein n=1 Tax=Crassaminicella profunda TaxID=1286698 RepID=UPI001CA760C6|nr:hypothetical protein [Crassaminicella profunda]QZY55864.1 hypothetical protein K7H06_02275 [Crassaminicella profunda]
MIKSMKKTSVLIVALMMLLSLNVVHAASDVNVAIYKDGSTTKLSMSNDTIVPGSQKLVMNGDEAILTFHIQPMKFMGIPGNLVKLSVDFGDGNYIPASFVGDKVTLKFPASKLKDGKNFYPAKVKSNVWVITIPTSDVEFCITK